MRTNNPIRFRSFLARILHGLVASLMITSALGQAPSPSPTPAPVPMANPGVPAPAVGNTNAVGNTSPATIPATIPPALGSPRPVVPMAGQNADLVEKLLISRKEYQRNLETLRIYYIQTNQTEKAKWAEDELIQYHRIAKQPFIFDLDVPPATLGAQATQNSAEANEIYRRALTYKDRGWGTDYIDNQRRAEILLQQVLTAHPTSNRISDTAYQLGELYESKAYKQHQRAALYYDRSVQWNPQQAEARMRAAKLYEQYNIDRPRAKELFKDVTTNDTDQRRVEEAKQHLDLLAKNR
ncbi:MAG: hypothetical protein NT142_04440 [Planctomycetota bacterium]|nr:hypothetical protein [Planctomycetota bacterium]